MDLSVEDMDIFKKIFEKGLDAIFTLDLAGHITYVSSAIEQISGYKPEEVRGNGLLDYLLESDRSSASKALGKVINGSERKGLQYNLLKKDGSKVIVDIDTYPILKDGIVVGCQGILRDITDRKISEKALYENEEFVRSVLDSLKEHIAVLDRYGNIVAVNNAWKHFAAENGGDPSRTGVDVNYLEICRKAIGGKSADEAPRVLAGIQALLDNSLEEFSIEYPCHSPEERRWFLLSAMPMSSDLGGAVVSHINITERKLAEEEQQRNSENMAMLIRESPTPIIFVNSEGRIVIINRKAENLLGYEPGELIGSPLSAILSQRQSLSVADRVDLPIRIVSKLGTEIPSAISTSVQLFRDRKSGIQERGMIVILKDLSELQGLSIAPTREAAVNAAAKALQPLLEPGHIYLAEEERPTKCIILLRDLVNQGAQGLIISREKPDDIRSVCHLEKTPFIWLTRNKMSGENCIAPDELSKLNKTVENFIEEAEQGVLFFDGLEYLIAQNGFNTVLKFLYALNDTIKIHNSLAIWIIDPLALDTRELHILRRETRNLQH